MTTLMSMSNVSFCYDDTTKGIHNVSLTINKGEWVTIVGQNGSGKSTLGKVMMGLLPLQHGEMYFENDRIGLTHEKISHPEIAYVFQNPDNQFVGITVEEDIAFGLENRQVPSEEMQMRIDAILKAVCMSEFAKSNCDELSGGQKQRVAIASALALYPKLLILDEATTMLDPVARLDLLHLLKELQQQFHFSVLAITHHRQELPYSDKIVVMSEGSIVKVVNNNEIVDDTLNDYGVEQSLAQQLSSALHLKNRTTPQQEKSVESMAEWIWTSYLKK